MGRGFVARKLEAQPSDVDRNHLARVREGEWNSWCSGEMRRYQEEHPWRQLSGTVPDAETRKRGERTGLDTLVVHCKRWALGVGGVDSFRAAANALSAPPGEYGRKAKTQRN